MQTTWIVPCYNEESRWSTRYWEAIISETRCNWIFVDDGSSDDTYSKICELEGANVKTLRLDKNLGKSRALISGFQIALDTETKFVGFMDADGAFEIADIIRIEQLANEKIQLQSSVMVWGSRVALAGHDIVRTKSRHYLGRLIHTFLWWNKSSVIYDTQCGIKLFSRNDDLILSLDFMPRTKWFFDLELYMQIFEVQRTVPQVYEYPLQYWREVPGSKISLSKFFPILLEIFYVKHLIRRLD